MTRRGFFVTGTDTGVGKTVVSCAIARAMRSRGVDVGVMKPAETGVGPDGPQDARALRDAAGVADTLDEICPFQFALPAAPSVAARHAGRELKLDEIVAGYARLAARHEQMLVEGAGGLLVPLTADHHMGDLARQLQLEVIVVARMSLGTINHTLLSLREVERQGLVLAGVILSEAGGPLSQADRLNLEALRGELSTRLLGEIPFLAPGRHPHEKAIAIDRLVDRGLYSLASQTGDPTMAADKPPRPQPHVEPPAPARASGVDPFRDSAAPELAAVRSGEELDWNRIEAYLREHVPAELEFSGAFEVMQFPNGAANLTYCIRFGERELVLRRPPFGTLAPGAHDMKREYKVLSRLWRAFDRAPRAFVFCDDPAVAGADFFVMERRRGEVIRGVMPETMRHHARVGQRVGKALIEAMADFHGLDPADCDLADLGRPQGFVERQVKGWKKRWDLVAAPECDDVMSAVHARLEQAMPEPQRVSFVHNDLKLDNCMFDPKNPDRVIAFFDWDMTTLGDPLVDLGTLLNYWPDPSDAAAVRVGHAGMERMGLPTRSEVKQVYAERSGLDTSHAPWYEAFAIWKTATVAQQLYYRWAVGDSSDPRMKEMGASVPRLAEAAGQLLDGSQS